jgi:Asp/Glu/hydantoin racemase
MRIAFVHTVGFLVDRFRGLMAAEHPKTDCFHILNENLLQDLLRGESPVRVYRRVVAQVLLAADGGADLVVVTCSSTSPAVDIARQVAAVPVLKIDDPMAAEAVRLGRRIAVLCTNASTPGPSEALLRAHAAIQNKSVEIEAVVRPDAYQALLAGDRAGHDATVRQAAQQAAGRADVLVLAQASIGHLQEELAATLGKPVLASPPLLMQEIARHIAAAA